jgi:nucleotide-binding universal stress UspA family protein
MGVGMIRVGWPRGLAFNLARGIMFSSIVVGTDGSDTATQAVHQAVDMAGAVGATLELVSAYAPVPEQRLHAERRDAPEDLQWAISPHQEVDAALASAADVAREAGVNVNTHARQGDPSDAILDVAEECKADLVIVGNKGMTGAKRFLLGSVPNKVSHHATCSVLIVRTT